MEENKSNQNKWIIRSNTSDYNLQRVVDEIKLGNEEKGGINLKPFYQRSYKFTVSDESLLIESLLGGIPIPLIYLASDTTKVPHITNVIDGQHRLTAIDRFMNNKFKLKGLEKFPEYNGLSFKELPLEEQNRLKYQISLTLQFIHTQSDPELELEIFTRYNKGTHPLTKQEIRNVVFTSDFNDSFNKKITDFNSSPLTSSLFNMTKKRFGDKTIHQELFVLFGIYTNIIEPNYYQKVDPGKKTQNIKNGINLDYYSSTNYVDEIMSFFREVEKIDAVASSILKERNFRFLDGFIGCLKDLYLNETSNVEFPLSKEIYEKVAIRNHKMQTSILMILVPVISYLLEFNFALHNLDLRTKVREAIKSGFLNSQFPKTKSSTTEPKLVSNTVESILYELGKISS